MAILTVQSKQDQKKQQSAISRPYPLRNSFSMLKNIVDIAVGELEKPFLIHRELLVHHSRFFAAALTGDFYESQTQRVMLADESTDIFGIFAEWLYTQELKEAAFLSGSRPRFFLMLELYAFADRHSIEALCNATVDIVASLADKTNSVPTPSDTDQLYETIRDTAPIRNLILDLFIFKKTESLLDSHPDEWNPTFLRDLVVKLKKPSNVGLTRHAIRKLRANDCQRLGSDFDKACDICRRVLRMRDEHHMCAECGKIFCKACVDKGVAICGYEAGRDSICKPWHRGACRYHEHEMTEVCGVQQQSDK